MRGNREVRADLAGERRGVDFEPGAAGNGDGHLARMGLQRVAAALGEGARKGHDAR